MVIESGQDAVMRLWVAMQSGREAIHALRVVIESGQDATRTRPGSPGLSC